MGGKIVFNKKGFKLVHDDCLNHLAKMKKESVDLIFADPPYNLSNGGISCHSGKMVSVNKGDWDKSRGFDSDYEFTYEWIKACRRVLKDNGSIWISGTPHNIYKVGHALQALGFHILNDVTWFKPNAPPHLACVSFAHSHETIIWARKNKDVRHKFNYELMKKWDDKISPAGKQMRSVWNIPLTPQEEKKHGKHPTQKPMELLKRIVLSNSDEGDLVLDPFNGSGTTGIVANIHGRKYVGIDLEKKFLNLTEKRFKAIERQTVLTKS